MIYLCSYICIEDHFATPETKLQLNNIYNMSFTGSPLWDLFGDPMNSLEKTYNRAIRMIWDIPITSHRYLIEPLSEEAHLKFVFLKIFLNFKTQVYNSPKGNLKFLYSICSNDCRSTTGRNLRKIMLLCEKNSIYCLESNDLRNLQYFPVPKEEVWRLDLIKELIETRLHSTDIPGFSIEEINDLIDIACTK